MEIVPGIFQLKVPIPDNPLGFLNSYLVKTEEGSLLVDTGWNTEEAFQSLMQQLVDAGVSWSDLRYIVITHAHPDHFGLVGRLKEVSQAQIVLHKMEIAILKGRYIDSDDLVENMGKWLTINGVPEDSTPYLQKASLAKLGYVSIAQPDLICKGGEVLKIGNFQLELLWTPGHAQGHICLYDRQRQILFSGDHVLPDITPNVSMHVQSLGNPLADYLNALQFVATLPVKLILPAHGRIFYDLPERVMEIQQHHVNRTQEILKVLEGGAMSAYEIASLLTWSTGGIPWEKINNFTKRSAVLETISHLELLFTKDVLQKGNREGVYIYSINKC